MVTKEVSTKIVNVITPGAGVVVLRRCQISHIMKMHYFLKDLGLSRLGFEHPTFRLRGKRSNPLHHCGFLSVPYSLFTVTHVFTCFNTYN